MGRVGARGEKGAGMDAGEPSHYLVSSKDLSWVTGNAILGLLWKPQGYHVKPSFFEGGAQGRLMECA